MRILLVLLEIVIGLALVGTVATSTSSGSTALAAFSSAQALVIIIPLIFVAIILYAAYGHFATKRSKGLLIYEGILNLVLRAFQSFVQYQLRLLQGQ